MLSQKRHLNELGYTEEKVNSFMPLVQKAKTWAWKDCNVALYDNFFFHISLVFCLRITIPGHIRNQLRYKQVQMAGSE